MKKEYRTAEKLEDGKWVHIEFKDLKIDDEFRLFEATGEAVENGDVFKAVSTPYLRDLRGAREIKIAGKGIRNVRMKRVIIESPYKGDVWLNKAYGRFAMHDCIVNHNESPYASHLLYTQKNVLRDEIPAERKLGIEAGFYWRDVAEKTIFYVDLGVTDGMVLGIADCKAKKKDYEVRNFPEDLWEEFSKEVKYNNGNLPSEFLRHSYKKDVEGAK